MQPPPRVQLHTERSAGVEQQVCRRVHEHSRAGAREARVVVARLDLQARGGRVQDEVVRGRGVAWEDVLHAQRRLVRKGQRV